MQSAGNKRMYWDFWDILEIERMAHQKGFEPLTDRFVADYSIQLSYWCVMKKKRNGAPEGIRTPDRSVRSRLLYPAELLVRTSFFLRRKILTQSRNNARIFSGG